MAIKSIISTLQMISWQSMRWLRQTGEMCVNFFCNTRSWYVGCLFNVGVYCIKYRLVFNLLRIHSTSIPIVVIRYSYLYHLSNIIIIFWDISFGVFYPQKLSAEAEQQRLSAVDSTVNVVNIRQSERMVIKI